jgi:hypothetical protein
MTRHITLIACLTAALCTELAFAQIAPGQTEGRDSATSGSSPVAYVYVSGSPHSNTVEINAYGAASNGKLTSVPGSPFPSDVPNMATNRKYLFGTNGIDIDSFSVAFDGGLQQVASVNAQSFNSGDCGGPVALFLDRTGATLYDLDVYSDCANNAYQFFGVDGSTGELNYLGVTTASTPTFDVSMSFVGNNQYVYGASCYHWNQQIFGFARNSDGTLTELNIAPPMPTQEAGQIYCPGLTATDSTNHVAIPVQALNNSTFQPVGPGQLATYTADSYGNLTTTSTYSNMPKVALSVESISMSPSGNLLAVGGAGGLQVFHFNGANPITHYTGLLTTDTVNQMAWDNDNHLYAISQSAGKLFVFTVTPATYGEPSGSPYAIVNPQNIVVLAK